MQIIALIKFYRKIILYLSASQIVKKSVSFACLLKASTKNFFSFVTSIYLRMVESMLLRHCLGGKWMACWECKSLLC